ncbi:hypothetical protein G9A89_013094 [Geosiphon pyriformis]|nr:hypothetical protein G9A89_013094 [Geosiphon pyriformis]
MNNCVKQADIVHWHNDMNNLISVVTETKLKEKIHFWIVDRFTGVHVFISGLDSGHMRFGVAIIMDLSLAKHVCKILEVSGWLLLIKLLFRNKLSVSILGLYAGASLTVRFSQANEIKSLITKTVNKSSFIILGSDFNKDGSHKCASFKKCFDLSLVNSLNGSSLAKLPTWCNSRDIAKTIDYVFLSFNLVNVIMNHGMLNVDDFFDTNYKAVFVFKFDVKNANELKWAEFKDGTAANAFMFLDAFVVAGEFSDLDAMFHKLELLVSKLVKAFCLISGGDFALLLDTWDRLNSVGTSSVKFFFLLRSGFDGIRSELAKAKKSYCSSKMLESKRAEESCIRQAIESRMESFELDKSHTIRSVLECPFHKIVLDYLVVNDELVLEPELLVVSNFSDNWKCQFRPLDYVFDGAFSGVMNSISFNEMFSVILSLSDGKAAGFSGISNELWKHCDKVVLNMLLVLLNLCLKGVLMNTHPIALIKTACKILFKILSDRIFLTCSEFDILQRDNFSVLKGMTTQSPIFAIGSVVEDVLEKNRELWLVLQNMCKAYDLRSLIRIKMCNRFIRFFGSIHNNRRNRIITDFGLTSGYVIHDSLDQGEVFLPLLWHIFYDSLMCEVKRQGEICGYRLNSHFVSNTGHMESQAGLTSFFVAGAFVDNTIWVGSSQATTQHILDVASEFFKINNISINNNKTMAIPINCQVETPYLTVSGSSISIAKKGKPHHYLGIFLSSNGFLVSSLAKTHLDIQFFVNFVLKKAISDKQFSYLVSAVLFPIINALICKSLKSKSGLPLDFPNDALHHSSFKLASIIAFANSVGVLGCLFSHRSYDLQVLSWHSHHPLLFLAYVSVSFSNNFLADVVHIFSRCDLSLGGSLACAFCHQSGTLMSLVLGEINFLKCVSSLKRYGITFVEQLHNRNGVFFSWWTFKHWKRNSTLSDVHQSHNFGVICNDLLATDTAHLSVYTDTSLSGLGTVAIKTGAAVFFEDINSGLGVGVSGLVSSTMSELQVIALALKYVLSSHAVDLFSDSQVALDAYKSESLLAHPDFRNHFKSHLGILGNEHVDELAKDAALSTWHLSHSVSKRFLKTGGSVVSGNSRHFVHNVLHNGVNWSKSSLVWHPNSHLAAGFTSACTSGLQTYFMKSFHHWLPVAVHKCLYNRCYSSVVCLFCGDVEFLNHVFVCPFDAAGHAQLLDAHVSL